MASIRKRGNKWQVQVRRLGTNALSKTFHNRKDAETWARHIEVQVDRRDLPRDPRELERHTLGELINRYCVTVSPRKRGCHPEQVMLKAFGRQPICQKRLSTITPDDFAIYRDQRLSAVVAHTVKREFATLHHVLETAKNEWNLPLKANPLSNVTINCQCNRRERRLEEGELERIIQAAKMTRNPLILPIILFALETGLRRSEILRATWDHLDIENRVLRVPASKNGHPRAIPLSRPAIALLQKVPRESRSGTENADKTNNDVGHTESGIAEKSRDRIFPTTANALRLSWDRLLKRANIDNLHFHDLRHEAISRFFEYGLTAPEVALLSGHRDMRMLFRYSHAQNKRLLDQLDRATVAAAKLPDALTTTDRQPDRYTIE